MSSGGHQATIDVGVADEHELFRRGVVACLADDEALRVRILPDDVAQPLLRGLDVAVLSSRAADRLAPHCPVVICAMPAARLRFPRAFCVLDRRSASGAQLRASVRAAAAGLRVETPRPVAAIDPRGRRLLELLADGCSTREIATSLAYSERTIKKRIADLEEQLQVRSRAQLLAVAVRDGHI